jgi:hypothetical protein
VGEVIRVYENFILLKTLDSKEENEMEVIVNFDLVHAVFPDKNGRACITSRHEKGRAVPTVYSFEEFIGKIRGLEDR